MGSMVLAFVLDRLLRHRNMQLEFATGSHVRLYITMMKLQPAILLR
jgi:hypothetical protein